MRRENKFNKQKKCNEEQLMKERSKEKKLKSWKQNE